MESCDKELIIDYLTVKLIEDNTFQANPHIRARTAWIEAKKMFLKLSDEQKQNILRKIHKK
tara:strand:- start:40195 stop:40377 length:183 start_codon:yes stop_codon:yes gene_type:complete